MRSKLSEQGSLAAMSVGNNPPLDLWVSTYLYNHLRKRLKNQELRFETFGYSGFLGLTGQAIKEWSILTGNEIPDDWFYRSST